MTTAEDLRRAQLALYPSHKTVNIGYDELNRGAQMAVDRVTALVGEVRHEVEAPIRELHKPFGIYTECGHDHSEEELAAGTVMDIMEVGIICAAGLMYRICEHCCVTGGWGGGQTEECVTNHEHGKDEPICKTIAALDAAR